MKLRHDVISGLSLIALAVGAFGAPEPLQRDTQTKALIQSELDLKSVTVTLGSVTVSDAAGIRTFTLGSTNGTKIGATGDKMGFLGATPIVRPSSTTDLRQALINLGLYTTGGATPLNLNGGAFTAASITGTTGTFSSTMGITGNTTIGGTLGVTGASTIAALSATSGTFSTTLGVTGNTTIGGTLSLTGAMSGSSFSYSGNGTVGGTFGATGNATFGGTMGITGALSGSSAAFSENATVGGTFGVTGASTFGATSATNGTFSGTLGVSGTSTLATVNATIGNFSGTFHAGGNADFDGTMDIAGDTTLGGNLDVATDTVIGNDLDVGNNLDVDGALIVAGAAQTDSLTVVNGSILHAVTATTIAASGNSTFAGTLGITGALSGSSAAFSENATVGGTFGVTGNTTVGGSITAVGNVTGPINPQSGSILDYVDVRWHGVDPTGVTDSTVAFNAARAAARTANVPLNFNGAIVTISSPINRTVAERWIGNAKSFPDGVPVAGAATLKWAGTVGETMVTSTFVIRGEEIDGIIFDGDGLAGICLLIDSTKAGKFTNNYFTGFTITGLKTLATFDSPTWNVFENNIFAGLTAGNSCIWLHGGGGGNTCHIDFKNTITITNASRHGIRLGNCDNNRFFGVYHFTTDPTTSKAVIVEPVLGAGMPSANYFYHLQGEWEQPATTEVNPATIFGYDQVNGQDDPITNGTPLGPVYHGDGRITNARFVSTSASPTIELYNKATTSISGLFVASSDFASTSEQAGLFLGDSSAAGTIGGQAWTNTAALRFLNLDRFVIASNNAIPFIFAPGGSEVAQITTAGVTVTGAVNATSITQDVYVAPTLLNGWVNFGGGLRDAGYYKARDGRVWLQGVIKNGTTTSGTTLFTLPVGYRPAAREVFAVTSNQLHAEVQVYSDGGVNIFAGSSAYISLCGLSFRTD